LLPAARYYQNEKQSNDGLYSQSIDMYVAIYDKTLLYAVQLDWAVVAPSNS